MPSWREDERLHDLNDLLFFAAVAATRITDLPPTRL
jgi:hypothetical protein